MAVAHVWRSVHNGVLRLPARGPSLQPRLAADGPRSKRAASLASRQLIRAVARSVQGIEVTYCPRYGGYS